MKRPDRSPDLELRCPAGVGEQVVGEALVSAHGFSARYDLDPTTGVITRDAHILSGESIVGRVLVFPDAKGGVATSWRLLDLVHRGTAPAALIFDETNPVMVQGALLAELPLVHRSEPHAHASIRTGDVVALDPAAGTVAVWRAGPQAAEAGSPQ